MTDSQWLKEFVDEGSEQAFARLVERHVHLVYSAALRQVKDRQAAEDIAQLAFVALSKKAKTLRAETSLAAWLLVTTRYLALDALKTQARRKHHEQTAASMAQTIEQSPRPSEWDDMAPHLDAALASLSGNDRRAITLRYFEGQNLKQVADTMGISLDAAKQRVHRATLRMRAFFAARGVNVTAAGIGPAIAAHAVQLAPPHVAPAAVSAGLASKSAVSTTLGIKEAAVLMASTKTKIIAGAAAIVLLGGGAVATWKVVRPAREQVVVIKPSTSPSGATDAAIDSNWQEAFNATYGLAPGQIARYVAPPYIPQRQMFWDNEQRKNRGQTWKIDQMRVTFSWDDKGAHWSSVGGMGGLSDVLRFPVGLKQHELDASISGNSVFKGDWVVRQDATREQKLDAIAQLLSEKSGHPVHFVQKLLTRDAIVIRGNIHLTDKTKDGVIIFSDGTPPRPNQTFTEDRTFGDLVAILEDWMGKKVYNESTVFPIMKIKFQNQMPNREKMPAILEKLAEQTSLSFDVEPREMLVWGLADGAGPTTGPTTRP